MVECAACGCRRSRQAGGARFSSSYTTSVTWHYATSRREFLRNRGPLVARWWGCLRRLGPRSRRMQKGSSRSWRTMSRPRQTCGCSRWSRCGQISARSRPATPSSGSDGLTPATCGSASSPPPAPPGARTDRRVPRRGGACRSQCGDRGRRAERSPRAAARGAPPGPAAVDPPDAPRAAGRLLRCAPRPGHRPGRHRRRRQDHSAAHALRGARAERREHRYRRGFAPRHRGRPARRCRDRARRA